MAVITALQRVSEPKGQDIITKKYVKSYYKTRPITATLDHPLILDIKLLKKLDMTTFTKKGLIALSKFCGISLITKTDTKKKLNKCVKTMQYAKKQSGIEGNELSIESNKNFRTKRKYAKQVAKSKPRIKFKIATEETSPDEDSLDVVCKKHKKLLKPSSQLSNSGTSGKTAGRKTVIDSILNGTKENVIPEPCKTCNRSEHPERFHSHPKAQMRLSMEGHTKDRSLEERFRSSVTTKDEKETKKIPCAKDSEDKLLQDPCSEQPQKTDASSSKSSSKSPSVSSIEPSSPETGKKSKTTRKPLTPSSTKSKNETITKSITKTNNKKEEIKIALAEEDLRFVTGCYVCGQQVSPKLRIKHEKTCIEEWRAQNRLVSPDKRKPEPKRPDYRFTGSGDLDYEATFESIWANHMDSLVPCKKCGRTFFPDRIEKHENCCNNQPINVKYKH